MPHTSEPAGIMGGGHGQEYSDWMQDHPNMNVGLSEISRSIHSLCLITLPKMIRHIVDYAIA